MMSKRDDDPDETEGRKLYRGQANYLARAQMSMARRKVKLVKAGGRNGAVNVAR